MSLNKKIIVLSLSLSLLLTGCTSKPSFNTQNNEQKAPQEISSTPKQNTEVQTKEQPSKAVSKEIDLSKIKPNEAGQIMVLMYHHISEPEGEWVRTPDNLRKDLQTLYTKGYRPISLKDYASGNITTEAGFTPVVLTFDDGRKNNFDMIKNDKGEWVINPNCAVAILEEFNRKHPDFPLEASFFVNDNIPFEQAEHLQYKLNYIIEKGMDVGNHTSTHVNFTNTDASRIQKEISGVVKMLDKYLPGYVVDTMALPFGSRPKSTELYTYLEKGSFEGVSYRNIAILNVGWDPDKSPYHKDFNPLAIHRIRASELQKYVQNVGMYSWIEQFEKGSLQRFVSDGDPDTVTVPEKYKDKIDEKQLGNRKIKNY